MAWRYADVVARAHKRGHAIVYVNGAWRWADTGRPATDERPCPKCGLTAEPDGPDPCLGMLYGIAAACCGHGVEEGYTMRAVWWRRWGYQIVKRLPAW